MKSTKKRIIIVFAILTMALVLSCAFVACNKTESDKTGTDKDVCEHVEVTDNAVEPTCTEKGLTEGTHCSKCGKILQAQNEIPALGHKYGDIIPKTEPTCSGKGVEAHYKCSVCNKVFKDDEHKTETTLAELTIAINPNAHNFGNWKKNEGADTHTRVCSFNNKHTETENCQGGTATCIEQATCEKCNAKYGELAKHDYQDGVCRVCGIRRPSEGLTYSLNSDENGYTVTGIGTCTDKELIIPSEYNAKPVTSIGSSAFTNCTGLTSVTIPDSVTSIGNYAFSGCTGLTNITIGGGVTSIGYSAFSSCYRLIEVYNKSTLTITAGSSSNGYVASFAKNVYANEGGSKLTTDENGYVIYTDGDEKILVVYHGTNTELILPSDITKIYEYAFAGCTGLTSVAIPDSVMSIGGYAFSKCAGLTSVTIPDSVTSIGNSAFSDCSGLTSVTIGKGVTSIGQFAFAGCTGLTSITIPNRVTSIGVSAFEGCTGLTSVTIGGSVTSIGAGAFSSCKRLTSITFKGTKKQWNAISKGYNWKYNVPSACKVFCTDGEISISEA